MVSQERSDAGISPKFGRVFWTRPFILTAYLYPVQPNKKGLAEQDINEFVHNPAVIKMYEDEIRDHLKKTFASYELPKKILLLSEGFTTENGMLTPTLKLKRREVLKKYSDMIDALYL